MKDIVKVLRDNEKETIKILKAQKDLTVNFADWDENDEVYENADDCPYIRYSNDDGEISTLLVVAARYNEETKRIEVITTDDEYEKTNNEWFPLNWADDISYWQVFDLIEEFVE